MMYAENSHLLNILVDYIGEHGVNILNVDKMLTSHVELFRIVLSKGVLRKQ